MNEKVPVIAAAYKEAERLLNEIKKSLTRDDGLTDDDIERAKWHFESLLRINREVSIKSYVSRAQDRIDRAEAAIENFQTVEGTRLYPGDIHKRGSWY